jgi:hypothetical protein
MSRQTAADVVLIIACTVICAGLILFVRLG